MSKMFSAIFVRLKLTNIELYPSNLFLTQYCKSEERPQYNVN